jgi:D-alanine--D-alanine ligase
MIGDARKLRVMLLFGGRSAEHDVSRVTAVAVAKALDPAKYDVVPVGITTDGRWVLANDAHRMLEAGRDALPAAFAIEGDGVQPRTEPGRAELVRSPGDAADRDTTFAIDVVLPMLHGPYGEDGTVQGLLELAGLPYVGAGVLGSAVGMDKIMMKRAFAAAGLPTARFLALRDGHDIDAFARDVASELGYPCFVKPSNMGSSVGVSKVRDAGELAGAIALALEYDEWAIAEAMIVGREIEVAVLGDDPPDASLPGEIVPGAEFYNYADKYEDGAAKLLAPAPLDETEITEVRSLAVRAFDACRCEAMARVDFFYADDGFVVNELNTIPGFTPISMYPRLWEVSGLPYADLLDRLIELAIARHARRQRRGGRQR